MKTKNIEKEGQYYFKLGNTKGLIEYKNGIITIYQLNNFNEKITKKTLI